jgi:gluconate 2-dehydrogenase gamma chain
MDRRESLKVLTIGTLGVGALLTSCDPKKGETEANTDKEAVAEADADGLYGRTPEEKERDARLRDEKFLTKAELATITVLSDIIIPADSRSQSASAAGVPDFIEFIVKDMPNHQTPMRGGLRWLDIKSAKLFNKPFTEASKAQQIELVDLIAYPDKAAPENAPGVVFFNLMRNLTATGFFSSKIGMADMNYMGNTPNAWDGVPDDVLKKYGLAYDQKTLKECLSNEDRGKMMTWENYPKFS